MCAAAAGWLSAPIGGCQNRRLSRCSSSFSTDDVFLVRVHRPLPSSLPLRRARLVLRMYRTFGRCPFAQFRSAGDAQTAFRQRRLLWRNRPGPLSPSFPCLCVLAFPAFFVAHGASASLRLPAFLPFFLPSFLPGLDRPLSFPPNILPPVRQCGRQPRAAPLPTGERGARERSKLRSRGSRRPPGGAVLLLLLRQRRRERERESEVVAYMGAARLSSASNR